MILKNRPFVTLQCLAAIVLTVAMASCATLTPTEELGVRQQGDFPDEYPVIPPEDVNAVELPPGYRAEVVMRDLIYPTTVEFDDDENLYIAEAGYAYGDLVAPARVLRVTPEGEISYVVEQLRGPITDLLWHAGHLYVASFGKVSAIGPNGSMHDLVTGLPASGGHQNNQMSTGPDGKIYFGMGTVTNSGVVGLDSMLPFLWLAMEPERHDVPAKDIRLTGETFVTPDVNNVMAKQGQLIGTPSILNRFVTSVFRQNAPGSLMARTGAFQPFGQTGAREIRGQVKSSGTILRMNPDGSDLEVYAWGLRNPFGVRWHEGRLYASDNAYDERGSRPIANAPDVIWIVRQDAWYGFPDYAAGIPVTDPQFRSTRGPAPTFLMEDHPPVEQPLLTRPRHSGITKFDFSRNGEFGFEGQMFLSEVGAGAPINAPGIVPAGHQIVRIDLKTGEVVPFFRTHDEALGPEGPFRHVATAGLKRPVDVRFSPDGSALYIADIGGITAIPGGAGPLAQAFPGSGAIWRITKEGADVAGPPAGLSPLIGRALGDGQNAPTETGGTSVPR